MSIAFTGAKAVLKMDSVPIAFLGNISISEEYRLEEIPQLDDLPVAEMAENGHRVSATVGLFKINGQAAADLELDFADPRDWLLQPEYTLELFDDTTGLVVYTMSGAKFAGGSGSADARGVWQGVWQFRGRIGVGL